LKHRKSVEKRLKKIPELSHDNVVRCLGYPRIDSMIVSRKRPLPGKSPDFAVTHLLNAHKRNEEVFNRKIYKYFFG
jgi:hypothetical protein